jgi:hypothetical protein
LDLPSAANLTLDAPPSLFLSWPFAAAAAGTPPTGFFLSISIALQLYVQVADKKGYLVSSSFLFAVSISCVLALLLAMSPLLLLCFSLLKSNYFFFQTSISYIFCELHITLLFFLKAASKRSPPKPTCTTNKKYLFFFGNKFPTDYSLAFKLG